MESSTAARDLSLNNEPPSQLQLGVGIVPPENPFSLFHKKIPQSYNAATALPTAPQPSYSDNGNAAYNINILDSKEDKMVSNLWIQQTLSNSNNNNANSMAMQSQLTTSQPLSVQPEMTQDYEEIHPFLIPSMTGNPTSTPRMYMNLGTNFYFICAIRS